MAVCAVKLAKAWTGSRWNMLIFFIPAYSLLTTRSWCTV